VFGAQRVYADAEIKGQYEIDAIVRQLVYKGYRPLLRSMLKSASELAKLDETIRVESVAGSPRFRRTSPIVGDVFFFGGDDETVAERAYVLQPMGTRLHAWEVRDHRSAAALSDFTSAVESAARGSLDGRRLRGMEFAWRPSKERILGDAYARAMFFPNAAAGRLLKKTDLKTKAADYSAEELESAQLLTVPEVRTFLVELARFGKARSVDSGLKQESTDSLVSRGVVRKEYLVQCRQDSHTICKIADLRELDTAGSNFTCTVCGRAFKEELLQEIFALTDLGKRLVSGSRWMTIWVTELLVKAGVPREQILWNATAGEDELDIMTDAVGPRVFFELKDRDFGLGDAYPFAIRVARYGGTYGVVVTTDRVADEAKKFFKEERPDMSTAIETIEGYSNFERSIRSLVDKYSRIGVIQLVEDMSEILGFNVVSVIGAWMGAVWSIHQTTGFPAAKPLTVPTAATA